MPRGLLSIREAMTADEWQRLAQLSRTSVAYLNQIALGFRRPSIAMAKRIEAAIPKVVPALCLSKETLIFSPLRHENPEK